MRIIVIATVLACLAVLAACGGGSTSTINANGQVSGNWQITLTTSPCPTKSGIPCITKSLSGFFLQLNDSVTGGLMLSGTCGGVGSATGSMSAQNISMATGVTGQALNLSGTVASDASSMGGNYVILASGCGFSENGTWSAARIQPLSGSFHGTLTSTRSGTISNVSGMVAQGPNGGLSDATLSGTITSTNSPCFTNASLNGAISGTAVVLGIVGSNGTSLGQLSLTSSNAATSLTGTYRFATQPQLPRGAPCKPGDLGTVSITLP
jgi:hypothetical protein